MALICLSRNLKDMEILFQHLCRLLLTKSSASASQTIVAIAERTGECQADLNQSNSEAEATAQNKPALDSATDEKPSTAIYRKSPFYKPFNRISVKVKAEIAAEGIGEMGDEDEDDEDDKDDEDKGDDQDDDDEDDEEAKEMSKVEDETRNKYYSPELLDHILSRWMPFVVFWSALDLDLVDPNISRITNAYVESDNKVTKEVTFSRTTNSSIADTPTEKIPAGDNSIHHTRLELERHNDFTSKAKVP